MNVNINYLEIIFWNNFLIPKVLIILISLILCRLLFKVFTKEIRPNGFEFMELKVNNRLITWICVILYISVFIFAIAILRFYRKGLVIDLKSIYMFFKFLWINNDYLFIIIILLLSILYLLTFVILLKYIKSLLEIHLLRLHIILWYGRKGYYAWSIPPYDRILITGIYREIVYWFTFISKDKLESKLHDVFRNIILYLDSKSFTLIHDFIRLFRTLMINSLNIKYNIILIPILVLYDCYYNQFIITTLFQFLPYYFVYTIWYKLSLFYYEANFQMDWVLYELYYGEPQIQYFRLDDDKIRLDLYVRNGLRIPPGLYNEYYYIETGSHAFRIQHYCKYELIDEVNEIYYNTNTNDKITLKEKDNTNENINN